MIHKRILDTAADSPTETIDSLAEEIPGASPALVERVLEEYGDPGATDTAESEHMEPSTDPPTDAEVLPADESAANGASESTSDQPTEDPSSDSFTQKQLEVLRLIRDNPEATQSELAETLGLSRQGVSQRVKSIDGFDWSSRREFVAELVENEVLAAPEPSTEADIPARIGSQVEELRETIETLQTKVEALDEGEQETDGATNNPAVPFPETQMTHKVMHACLASDRITEDEELEILETLMHSGNPE
jgi:DNA-binding CsgD family transcriptional regulator